MWLVDIFTSTSLMLEVEILTILNFKRVIGQFEKKFLISFQIDQAHAWSLKSEFQACDWPKWEEIFKLTYQMRGV